MTKVEIEQIIEDEITIDCYGDEEVHVGWYTFLCDNIFFPFRANYEAKNINGKNEKHSVTVVGRHPKDIHFNDQSLFVLIELKGLVIPVDIQQLSEIEAEEETLRAIEVWRYNSRW